MRPPIHPPDHVFGLGILPEARTATVPPPRSPIEWFRRLVQAVGDRDFSTALVARTALKSQGWSVSLSPHSRRDAAYRLTS